MRPREDVFFNGAEAVETDFFKTGSRRRSRISLSGEFRPLGRLIHRIDSTYRFTSRRVSRPFGPQERRPAWALAGRTRSPPLSGRLHRLRQEWGWNSASHLEARWIEFKKFRQCLAKLFEIGEVLRPALTVEGIFLEGYLVGAHCEWLRKIEVLHPSPTAD